MRLAQRDAIVVATRVPLNLQTALMSPSGEPPDLKEEADSPVKEKNQAIYELGDFPCAARFLAFRDCAENARCALLERVFYHEIAGVFTSPADPSVQVVGALLQNFRRKLGFVLPKATPVERHEYVAARYRGRRLQVYQAAVEKLDRRGLLESDSFSSAFLKFEKILEQPKRQVPRLIQPRAPAYNVELGRYLHPVEHVIFRAIDSVFGHPTVMKGLNASEQGEIFHKAWCTFQHPVALQIDASRFDQHIRSGLLKWEYSVYDKIYSNDPYLRMLLRWQLKTRGFMRSGGSVFKYKVSGGRCSGDMNTAVGNILVACAGVYEWLRSVNLHKKTRVLDAGDDCCIIGEAADIVAAAPTLQPWFDQLGLIMKVEPLVYVLEQVSFCQTQPVYDGLSWRMVRDPRVSLTKDAIVLQRQHLTNLKAYFASIGQCGLSLTSGLPVLQEYYTAMGAGKAEKSRPVDESLAGSGFFMLSRRMQGSYRPVTDEARVSFWRAFGIPPSLQIELEDHYRRCEVPDGVVPSYGEVNRVDLGVGVACCN